METSLVLKMFGLAAVLTCLILLLVPVSVPYKGLKSTSDSVAPVFQQNCGGVIFGDDIRRCDKPHNDRLTLSLVIGATGVVALYGASQVKKNEDD